MKNTRKRQKAAAPGKLVDKTVAFVGKFGYHDMFLASYQTLVVAEGGRVVDMDRTVPDYLVAGEGRAGNPPAIVAKIQKKHSTVYLLDETSFCQFMLPSREELCAELRSGPREY